VLAIFNSLGGGEVIAILIIGLIVLGPEKLPDAIRKFGNIYGEFRRMSQGFRSELRDAFDEPLQSLRGTAQMMQDSVNQPLQAITDMKAPVVGGAAAAETVEATATEADGAESGATEAADGAVAADATVEEVQAPVDDDEAPAGSAAGTWAAERTNGAEQANDLEQSDGAERTNGARQTNGAGPASGSEHPDGTVAPSFESADAAVEVEGEPEVREDEEPVLAEAGLLLSEPEMPTESSEDEERPG